MPVSGPVGKRVTEKRMKNQRQMALVNPPVNYPDIKPRINPLPPRVPLLSSSQCKGFTRISEDSSEIAFLLVENYTKTAHSVSSDRNGFFGPQLNGSSF